MLIFFLAGLTLLILVFIVVIKEFISSFYEIASLNKDLKKYTPKNRYEIRKLTRSLQQSKAIIESTDSLEEKVHWCSIIINTYMKLKDYTSEEIQHKIDKEINKYTKKFEELSKKISQSKIKNLTTQKQTNISNSTNRDADVA
jgi:biopolymer transport protein ExbB/TolQ